MTGLHAALQAFWGGFTYAEAAIPAYEQGNVPNDAAYPYITYEAVEGAYWGSTFLTAFVWVKKESGVDWQAQRAAILDLIALAIPTCGTTVSLTNGNARLERNPSDFMSYYDDPTDTSVAGGRVSYEISFYNR